MRRIDTYNLEYPGKEHAISSLSKVISRQEADAIWNEACETLGLSSTDESDEVLFQVFDYIANQPGLVSIYGLSLRLRLLSYCNILRSEETIKSNA